MKAFNTICKSIITFTFLALLTIGTTRAVVVPACEVSKDHGMGYTTSITSVINNSNNSYTIVLTVEHDGCGGPTCKELSGYSVEAIPGTYTDISVEVVSGNMTFSGINYGPNLSGVTFDGFRIENIGNIGDGEAGVFAITYTLSGGLQNQQTMAKAGPSKMYVSFTTEDFEYVLNCSTPPSTILPYYAPPENGKIDSVSLIGAELTSLYNTYVAFDSVSTNDIFQIVDDTSVVIEVYAIDGQFDALLSLLQTPDYGMTDITSDPADLRISGVFPIINLLSLNDLPLQVNYARPVFPGIPQVGFVTSQGDTSMLSFIARQIFDVAGEGIKIGVLSDSYNTQLGNPAADDVLRGDLPGTTNPNNIIPVQVLLDYPYGIASDEGRAMMHIIHDIAPKAELAFRTGLKSATDFADGIIELEQAGCDIIVDDITYITEPFLNDGEVSTAVDYVVSQGVSYFTAAGNFGGKSYQGSFNPASSLPTGLTGEAHNFATSGPEDIYQNITVAPGSYTVVLQWDDGSGPSETNTDIDIYLAYEDGERLFGFNRNNEGGASVEVLPFTVTDTSQTNILVVRASGTSPVEFKYVVFRGDITFNEYGITNASTIVGHANSEGAMTVGAVLYSNTPIYGVDPPTIASFSSRGGTNVGGVDRNKPDFTAPNGVNTNVDLGGFNIEGDPFPNFFGTSASAPHVAGVAALLLEAKVKYYGSGQTITPAEMRSILKSTAIDMDTPGFDNISGAGLVQADDALITLANPAPLISGISYDTALTPGIDTIPISVTGEYLTSGAEIYFNGEPLSANSTVSGDTLVSSTIPPYDERYPAIQVNNPPSALTNGQDGGLSNPLYFTTKPTIVIDINDTTKKYAEMMPQFTAEYFVETLDTIIPLSASGLSSAAITRITSIPLVTIANDTSNVGLWPVSVSLVDPLNPLSTVEPTDSLDIALLDSFNIDIENGILTIEKLDLLIVPKDTVIVFGDTITGFDFAYLYNNDTTNMVPISYEVDTAILSAMRKAHATALVNAVAKVRATALVNTNGDPLYNEDSLMNSSFFVTNAVMKQQATALVNGTLLDPLQLYNTIATSTATALVNAIATVRATALVNGIASVLVNGVATALVNTGALVNGATIGSVSATALVNTNTINDSTNKGAVVILGEDDILILTGDSTGSVEILSISVITGDDVGQHLILPGALISNNYNITYGIGEITVLPDTAEITFDPSSLVQTYDGLPKEPMITTDPPDINVTFTYNGNPQPPVNVGTYTVVAVIDSSNFVGSDTAVMTIIPDTAEVVFDQSSLLQVYDGTVKSASATTDPPGLALIYAYDEDPVEVGDYQVTATVNDLNYIGSATETLTVTPAVAAVTFDPASLTTEYTGLSQTVAVTTNPAGLTVNITYDGIATAPVNAGSYSVLVTVMNSNYTGSASDIFTIQQATAYVTADDEVILAGASLPTFTSTFSGFVNGEDESVVTSLTYSVSPSYSGSAGTYQIIPSATAVNYIFIPVNGNLYVNPYGWGAINIVPELICVEQIPPDEEGLTYKATFGYENYNGTDVYIPKGYDNMFYSWGNFNDEELPELFISGGGTFQVNFDGSYLKWKVRSYYAWWKVTSYAAAAYYSPSCYQTTSMQAPVTGDDEIQTLNGATEIITESKAYPNPVRDKVYLELAREVKTEDILVFNAFGNQSIIQIKRTSDKTYELDLSGLVAGVYLIRVNMGDNIETFRIVKQ